MAKFTRLSKRILGYFLLIFVSVFGAYAFQQIRSFKNELIGNRVILHEALILHTVESTAFAIWNLDKATLETSMRSLFRYASFQEVVAVNGSDSIYVALCGKSGGVPESCDGNELRKASDGLLAPESDEVRVIQRGPDEFLTVANLVYMEDGERRLIGRLVATFETHSIRPIVNRHVLGSFLFAVVVGVLMLVLVFTVVQRGIVRPVRALTDAAVAFRHGEIVELEPSPREDEIGTLIQGFRSMVHDIRDYQMNLEEKVRERTQTIAMREHDIQLMLDHSGDGFLSVAETGLLNPQHSQILAEWFGTPAPGSSAWDYLFHDHPDECGMFEALFEDIWQDEPMRSIALQQLPSELSRGGRSFSLVYRPVVVAGRMNSLLIVISDVTESLLLAQAQRERNEDLDVLEAALGDEFAFRSMTEEIETLLRHAQGADATELKRILHTIKGATSSFALTSFAEKCHALETDLEQSDTDVPKRLQELQDAWVLARKKFSRFLRNSETAAMELSPSEYEALTQALSANPPAARALLESLRLPSALSQMKHLASWGRTLAARLAKPHVTFEVFDRPCRFPPSDAMRALWSALPHVVSNAIDHGIEPVAERVRSGKSEQAVVRLSAETADGQLVVTISDDGRGVDFAQLEAKARSKGIALSGVDLLFADGVSSKDVPSLISGRGVGMSAVKEAVDRLGGRIEILTEMGRGTTIRLSVPAGVA